MDAAAGIAGIHQRIAEIQSRFAVVASSMPPAGGAQGEFAGHLQSALSDAAPDAAPGAAPTATLGAAGAVPLRPWGTPVPVSSLTGSVAGVAGGAGVAGATGVAGAAPGGRTRASAPAELQQYGNGRIPAAALEPLGIGNHRLWQPAAVAFRQLHADARAAGIDIKVTDSYRSYESQVDVARRKGLYSQGGLAATPGTSNHGWGLSVDLGLDSRAQAWMRANAGRYGFVEDVPREPWHWTFHGTG